MLFRFSFLFHLDKMLVSLPLKTGDTAGYLLLYKEKKTDMTRFGNKGKSVDKELFMRQQWTHYILNHQFKYCIANTVNYM